MYYKLPNINTFDRRRTLWHAPLLKLLNPVKPLGLTNASNISSYSSFTSVRHSSGGSAMGLDEYFLRGLVLTPSTFLRLVAHCILFAPDLLNALYIHLFRCLPLLLLPDNRVYNARNGSLSLCILFT